MFCFIWPPSSESVCRCSTRSATLTLLSTGGLQSIVQSGDLIVAFVSASSASTPCRCSTRCASVLQYSRAWTLAASKAHSRAVIVSVTTVLSLLETFVSASSASISCRCPHTVLQPHCAHALRAVILASVAVSASFAASSSLLIVFFASASSASTRECSAASVLSSTTS